MEEILPIVATLAGRHPEQTVFSRFIPPERPDQMYVATLLHTLGRAATGECLDLDLLEPLAALCPPAKAFDRARRTICDPPRGLNA